ncbi:MAG: hypothetical protein H7Y30_03520 [Pyrinomonadaceae bacterium]|nr:hypothetical protein [Pyrinomonadaceae bacterium]
MGTLSIPQPQSLRSWRPRLCGIKSLSPATQAQTMSGIVIPHAHAWGYMLSPPDAGWSPRPAYVKRTLIKISGAHDL